jgi:hypothetical protein
MSIVPCKSLEESIQPRLVSAVNVLGGKVAADSPFLKQMIEAYQNPGRKYHNLEHAHDLMTRLENTDDPEIVDALDANSNEKRHYYNALKAIAGLGHDLIQQKADGGYGVFAEWVEERRYILKQDSPSEPLIEVLDDIFAIGEKRENRFSNEYLSAFITADFMQQSGINQQDIYKVIATIEATRFFPMRDQKTFKALKERMRPYIEEPDLTEAMRFATHFANEDVKNFRVSSKEFIDNTFKIYQEIHSKGPLYALKHVEIAENMTGGINNFYENREDIFHFADDVYPSAELMEQWNEATKTVTGESKEYFDKNPNQIIQRVIRALSENSPSQAFNR